MCCYIVHYFAHLFQVEYLERFFSLIMKSFNPLLPSFLLRIEGATVGILSIVFYFVQGGNWLLFVLLFLTPDLSAFGYLAGTRVGAYCYNFVHTYLFPALLGAYGLLAKNPLALSLALIWCSHIGVDRMLGLGLKYPTAFKDTHLGRV
jgi:hypothetical protein